MASLLPSDYHALTRVERSRGWSDPDLGTQRNRVRITQPGRQLGHLLCWMDITPTHRAFAEAFEGVGHGTPSNRRFISRTSGERNEISLELLWKRLDQRRLNR